ncbi:MAG: YIP1 family protein [Bacteroidetes bacterium]|nr:YIP1 family protein [Bacteroidota bacterium]
MNVFDRFTALFSSPSEAFEGLIENPLPTSQIIISISIAVVVTALMSFWIYSTPEVRREIFEMQKDKIEQMVADGKMSQSQADQSLAQMESFSEGSFGTIITVVTGVIMAIGLFFIIAVYYLVMAKFFGTSENYTFSTALSTLAVLTIFSSLMSLVSSSLIVIGGSMNTNLGPVLLLDEFNSKDMGHKLIAAADLLMWFYLFLMMLGFKITSKSSWLVSVLIILVPYLLVKAFQLFM